MTTQQISSLLGSLSGANWKLEVDTTEAGTHIALHAVAPRIELGALFTPPVEVPEPTEIRVPSRLTEKHNPGVYLSTLLIQANVTKKALSEALELSPSYINELLEGKKPLSADAAVRLEKCFPQLNVSAEMWAQMQATWTLYQVRSKQKL